MRRQREGEWQKAARHRNWTWATCREDYRIKHRAGALPAELNLPKCWAIPLRHVSWHNLDLLVLQGQGPADSGPPDLCVLSAPCTPKRLWAGTVSPAGRRISHVAYNLLLMPSTLRPQPHHQQFALTTLPVASRTILFPTCSPSN